MTKTVVIVGALDTKGEDFAFVKEVIESQGVQTLVVDFGVLGAPKFAPDITRDEVAAAGGANLKDFQSGEHKDKAMQAMAKGLARVVERLYGEGRLDGIIGMGGTGGTSLTTAAMRTLPVGVPKVMVSTVGGGDVSAFAGEKDITFIPSIVDVAGINRISRPIYANAAGAVAGMAKARRAAPADERPLLAASMFGNTTKAIEHARPILEKAAYEVLVFHATGAGGRTMESLIADGYISGVFDITTTELADHVCGGVFSAGPDRCLAAAKAGVPAVLAPGCVDMANFGGPETVPEKYVKRRLYHWNPNVTLLRTNVEENIRIGKMIGAAANVSRGPVSILLPLRGVSMLDSQGGEFWDPEADAACYTAIRDNVKPDVRIVEIDANINDDAFSEAAARELLTLIDANASSTKE